MMNDAIVRTTESILNVTETITEIDPYKDNMFMAIASRLNEYGIPAVTLAGFVGNTVSFCVFVATHLNRQSSSIYLAFLAFIDNVLLISVIFIWTGNIHVVQIFHMNGWCQMIHFLNYVATFLSVWTVVSFTAERYIVVFFPLRRHQICTRRRATIVMMTLTLGGLAFYSFSIPTYGVVYASDTPLCTTMDDYMTLQKVMTGMDVFLGVFFPNVAIITMNGAISYKVYSYTRKIMRLNKQSPGTICDTYSSTTLANNLRRNNLDFEIESGGRSSRTEVAVRLRLAGPQNSTQEEPQRHFEHTRKWRLCTKRQRSQMRVTRALLVISTVFIILHLPSNALRIMAFAHSFSNEYSQSFNDSGAHLPHSLFSLNESLATSYNQTQHDNLPLPEPSSDLLRGIFWHNLIQFLSFLGSSTNFFLYMIFSRNFRSALNKLIRRKTIGNIFMQLRGKSTYV